MKNNEWHFFVDGFMSFMREEFPKPLSNHFTYDLLRNTVNLLIEKAENPTQLVDWIKDIVPEVETEEIEYWINR